MGTLFFVGLPVLVINVTSLFCCQNVAIKSSAESSLLELCRDGATKGRQMRANVAIKSSAESSLLELCRDGATKGRQMRANAVVGVHRAKSPDRLYKRTTHSGIYEMCG